MNSPFTSQRPSLKSFSQTIGLQVLVALLLAVPLATASAATVNYTDGSQVNLLNAWNATMSISGTNLIEQETPDQARFINSKGYPASTYYSVTSNPAASLDFGTARTVKTVTFYTFDAPATLRQPRWRPPTTG